MTTEICLIVVSIITGPSNDGDRSPVLWRRSRGRLIPESSSFALLCLSRFCFVPLVIYTSIRRMTIGAPGAAEVSGGIFAEQASGLASDYLMQGAPRWTVSAVFLLSYSNKKPALFAVAVALSLAKYPGAELLVIAVSWHLGPPHLFFLFSIWVLDHDPGPGNPVFTALINKNISAGGIYFVDR